MKKEMLISSLIEKGWYHEDHFLPEEFCSELLEECKTLDWKTAHVGQGADKQEALGIRNDSIAWIDEALATPLQKRYFDEMAKLLNELNRELYLGLREFECHFAHYKTSGFYKKHLDQHKGSQKRLVSAIFYLNEPFAGGELAIYNKEDPSILEAKIKPRAGSFVCFLSNQIYHEVLPTESERYSLTGWFRTL